jgi:serine phosphatase RsbU (regulator of sigma subunit)
VTSATNTLESPPPAPAMRTWLAERAVYAQGGPCGDRAFVLPFSAGRTAIVVIDVAAHGSARAQLSSAVAETIASSLRRDASPAAALGRAHAWLRSADDEYPYAVAFVALVNPVQRTVLYASAGHDCAFALDDDGRIRHLAPTAPMLGIPLAVHACDALFSLGPAETLVIATDGIADSRPAGTVEFFGVAGAARAVTRSLRAGADPALATLDAARIHADGRQHDDVAVVVARVQAISNGGDS